MVDDTIIYDIETLSQDQYRGVIVSLAILPLSMTRIKHGLPDYQYDELLDKTIFVKFNVAQQVKEYGRNIDPDTLNWWKELPAAARKQLDPSPDDMDLKDLYDFFVVNVMLNNLKRVYTRNNTFDPTFIQFACQQFGKPIPYPWWYIRDTKSTIDGMTWGQDIEDKFIPAGLKEKFIEHDPRHDIVMDAMRFQYLSRILIDEIPF